MDDTGLPPLNWLRAFEASARHLSFTSAAQELNMTQSAVSQQIKALEGYLGKALFYRLVRRLELTDAGNLYLPWVQDSFSVLTKGTQQLLGPDRAKTLQIVSNLAFTVHWLAPRLPKFFAAHPKIRLNFTTPIWHLDHTSQSADLEIRFGRAPDSRLMYELLTQANYFPICAPGDSVTLDTLFDRPLFDCAGLSCNWESWCTGQGISFPKKAHLTYASTYAVSFSAAVAGSGLAIGHDILVADMLRDGILKRPFDHVAPVSEAYYLIHPAGHVASPASQAFSDWLKSEIRGLNTEQM